MRHWVFAFGPDAAKMTKEAELLALRLRKGSGVIIAGSMPAVHVDDMPMNSVVIRTLYNEREALFAFSEEKLIEYVLDFNDSKFDKDYAVIDQHLDLTLPKGVAQNEVSKLAIRLQPDIQQTLQIRWGADVYYPSLTSKKLSGKKFNLKD